MSSNENKILPRFKQDGLIFDDGIMVLCPVCGFEYVHMKSVLVHQDNNIVVVTRNEVTNRTGDDLRTGQKGTVIAIEMFCESGHVWDATFSFCKGNTKMSISSVETGTQSQELWRD